jgi:hypothetical protein
MAFEGLRGKTHFDSRINTIVSTRRDGQKFSLSIFQK